MNDIEFFASLCTKDELVKFIRIFDINISGFSRKPSKAPEKLLRSKFVNKIIQRKFAVFDKICETVSDVYGSSDIPEDFNSFILLMLNKKDYISEADIFCFLAKKFPNKKSQYMPELIDNHNKGNHILEMFVQEINITEENAIELFLKLNDYTMIFDNFYEIYSKKIIEYYETENKKDEYLQCLEKLRNVSWAEFVNKYIKLLNDFKESIIFSAYLIGNKDKITNLNDENIKYIHLLMIYEVVINFVEDKSDIILQKHNTKAEDLASLQDDYDTLNKKKERLEKSHKKLEKTLSEVRSKNKNLIEELKIDIRNKNKIIEEKNNEITKLKDELTSKVNKDKLLKKWGEVDNDLKLVIISYEDSSLFKLLFGKYIFIDSNKNVHNVTNMLKKYSSEYKIIINKAKLNTGKLLDLEDNLKEIDKTTIFANSPRELVIKTIPDLEGRI